MTLERFARRKPNPVRKLATGVDPRRKYLAGLLMRFDEGYSDAISFATELKPSYSPRPISEFTSESEMAGSAALSVALGIAAEAMGEKVLVGTERVSIFDGAIGICYGLFIFNLFRRYLKEDGVEIDYKLLARGAVEFAEMYVYLDRAARDGLFRKGLEIYRDMIKSDHRNVKDWHDMLSKTVQLWLVSTTSVKRTTKIDDEYQTLFASQLRILYDAVEKA